MQAYHNHRVKFDVSMMQDTIQPEPSPPCHRSIYIDIGLQVGACLPIEAQRVQLRLVIDAIQVYSFSTIGKMLVLIPCRDTKRVPLLPRCFLAVDFGVSRAFDNMVHR